jgi:hypothetical protein
MKLKIIDNYVDEEKFSSTILHILKSLHNSFIIHGIRQTIQEGQKFNSGDRINKILAKTLFFKIQRVS